MNPIKVSVIVPVYNVEQYLAKCLDSLVNQTLEEIEIIVVNDGSPDNSQIIVDDYANRYPDKIRAYKKENGGLSDARNFGVSKAIGEYIGFVDSDDFVDSTMYEEMYLKAIESQADVVCCPCTYEYENRAIKNAYDASLFGKPVLESPKLLTYANSFAHNKIYRRAFWMNNNFSFPLRQWFEDSHLIYNVMLSANKVELVNYPFMHYVRDREGSITNKFDMRVFDIFSSAKSIISYYKEHDSFEPIIDEIAYICLRHMTTRVFMLRKCPDKKEACRFIHEMIDILDSNFSNWKSNRYLSLNSTKSLKKKCKKLMLRSRLLMTFYVYAPNWLVSLPRNLKNAKTKLKELGIFKSILATKKEKASQKQKEEKRKHIQENGMAVLHEIQTVLSELGITSFADFGTCLGLVREGHLLKHDLDMDIGVIATPEQREQIRMSLEKIGCKMWRQYKYLDNPVEDSYYYKDVKVDLNFYEITEDYARTWLFYSKPGHVYENAWTRHVVQMTYTPIKGVKYQEFNGQMIALPENPELLMEEKYGPSWRTPDTGWIYWESPAAIKLDEIGGFKTYTYRSWDYLFDPLEETK